MTAAELAARHRRRAAAVPREFQKTMNGVKISMVKFTKELMTTEIYAIPEDLTEKGKKKWRRTGHLRRSERAEVTDPYTCVLINDAIYARRREAASGSAGRGKKTGDAVHYVNPLRECHWREKAKELWESIKEDLWHATVRDIMETR
jgi:hypothetical protein